MGVEGMGVRRERRKNAIKYKVCWSGRKKLEKEK
jgi:hypothetical protein